MKTSQMRESNDVSPAGLLDGASVRALLFQGEMGSCRMVIGEIGSEEPFEMGVVVDDDVIDALAADGADQAFDVGVLPG